MESARFDSGGAVSVTTAFTTVFTYVLGGLFDRLSLEVENVTGSAATLNDFKIQLQDAAGGEFYDYLSLTDFDAADHKNIPFSGTTGVHEVAAGGFGHCSVRLQAANAVRFQAKVAANTANVKVRGTVTD